MPQTFAGAAGNVNFTASASATNSVIVGGQQAVRVTTQNCDATKRVMPNLVDTLTPNADKTNRSLLVAKALWAATGFTGTLTATPDIDADFVRDQSVTAYSCVNATQNVSVNTQVTQP